MQALSDVSGGYEDNYQSLDDVHQGYYGDQSPTEFYPMMQEQKFRPPPLKNMCRGINAYNLFFNFESQYEYCYIF